MNTIIKPAIMDQFESIMTFVESNAIDFGFDSKVVKKIRLACEEIVLNIINYAYPKEPGEIELRCYVERNKKEFCIEISDWGIPFNPLEAEKPDIYAPLNERKIGGLGIFLTRKVMDDIIYEHKDDKNKLILKKIL